MYSVTKSIFESKTFWANLITTALGILTLLLGEDWIKEIPGSEGTLLAIIGLLNIALRFVTVDAVKLFAVVFVASIALASEAHAAVQIVSVAEPKPVVVADPVVVAPVVPVKSISLARPGYTCGPNGCYPTAKTQAVKRAPVKAKGFWQRLFNR